MPFDVNEIKSAVNKHRGLARTAHFAVSITPPGFARTEGVRDFEFFCESAMLPGIHLDTMEIRPLGYGSTEKRPYNSVFNNVRCDILMDNRSSMLTIFHRWLGNIHNFSRDTNQRSNATSLRFYEFAYPVEYEGTVLIVVLDTTEQVVTRYTLNQAYPVTIGDIGLAWDHNNTIIKVPITFAFNVWSSQSLPFNAAATNVLTSFNALRTGIPSITVQPTTIGIGSIAPIITSETLTNLNQASNPIFGV